MAKTVTLLNTAQPYFQIYDPNDGSWVKFVGGKLELADDDPHFGVVMEEAARNPQIVVYESIKTCAYCGESFGSAEAVKGHVKDVHFEKWADEQEAKHVQSMNAERKKREGVVCDACNPPQTFPDDAALADHVALLHTAAPADADADEPGGGGGEAPATEIPAAKPSKRAQSAKA